MDSANRTWVPWKAYTSFTEASNGAKVPQTVAGPRTHKPKSKGITGASFSCGKQYFAIRLERRKHEQKRKCTIHARNEKHANAAKSLQNTYSVVTIAGLTSVYVV